MPAGGREAEQLAGFDGMCQRLAPRHRHGHPPRPRPSLDQAPLHGCDHLLIAAKPRMQKTETCSGCRPPAGTTVSQLPEPRPQPVAREPEPRCQASTEIAQLRSTAAAVLRCCTDMKKAGFRDRNRPLTWSGAKGIRTPDLLHAMHHGFVRGSPRRSGSRRSERDDCLTPSRWVCRSLSA